MRRWLCVAFIFFCSVGTSGCIGGTSSDAKAIDTSVTDHEDIVAGLQPGDKLRLTVFGEDKLTGEYEIDKSGSLNLPLAGTLRAAGLTLSALETSVTDRLKSGYLRSPKVTAELISTRPFYILGEVEKPGEYPYRVGLDIWRAMAIAGGPTYRASSSTVLIQSAGGIQWREYALATAPPVSPGDAIRVPERWF